MLRLQLMRSDFPTPRDLIAGVLLQLAHLLDQAAGAVKLPAATPALPGEGY